MVKLSQVMAAVVFAGVLFSVKPVYADGYPPTIQDMIYHTSIAKDGTSGTILITGGASDPDNDLRRVEVELDANGNWVSGNYDGMRWIYSSPSLPLGKHSFRVRASDYAGNVSTTDSYNFELFKCVEFTSNNVVHVSAGRAKLSGLTAYAKGSGDKMGYYSLFVTTKLAETGSGYYVVGACPQ
ncbi:MAG: Ig-like domain-containing protein [Burkholderiaceae bacterium]